MPSTAFLYPSWKISSFTATLQRSNSSNKLEFCHPWYGKSKDFLSRCLHTSSKDQIQASGLPKQNTESEQPFHNKNVAACSYFICKLFFFITINLQIWIYSPKSTAISTVTTSLNYTELFSHHPCPQLSSLSSEQTSCGHLHFNEDSAFCGKQLVKLPHLFPCVLIRYFFNPLTLLKYRSSTRRAWCIKAFINSSVRTNKKPTTPPFISCSKNKHKFH